MHVDLIKLRKMQQRVALWILGAFKTSPSLGIKAIARLVPIHLYFRKLSRYQLRVQILPHNHIIKSKRYAECASCH